MKTGRIQTAYYDDPIELVITADADGLRFLADICLRLIDKTGPASHWHLMENMGTLEPGSINTRISFEQTHNNEHSKTGKIKTEYHTKAEEFTIAADADGLRFLADICLRLIDKTGPASHWHLMENMGTLESGSINTRISFEQVNDF
jgi:hypothetical protein